MTGQLLTPSPLRSILLLYDCQTPTCCECQWLWHICPCLLLKMMGNVEDAPHYRGAGVVVQ